MKSRRHQLIELLEQGYIPDDKIDEALTASKIFPDSPAWQSFINHALTWLGGLAIAFSALFFIAFNWYDLGRFAKFAMVEGLIIAAVLFYCMLDKQKVSSKVALFVASILLGVLLALVGQTYQTGADPWQLFFFWAMLMLPWALIGRFSAIWVLWLGLINLSIVLYSMSPESVLGMFFNSDLTMLWALFLFNIIALAVWEVLATRYTWLAERWPARLLAVASGTMITWLGIYAIFEGKPVVFFIWLAWLGAIYGIYRYLIRDLLILAGAGLSVIIIATCLAGLLIVDTGGLLMLAIVTLGTGAGVVTVLKHIQKEWQS
ncbi:putative membrane protein DUF2157 [Sinobacterium caligoides]|uniref:Putative membrane protein DUF2157 n=1 Tax=Sinobacterium caligoides TaxID=933926 RepID=A0A3N2D569_9GAMM|nr:DUF2157 domain-containing protein [Sinobacterium caligoides]ROR94909.1 putative membrane protein DUF2157 [Sinobacterium caligoides]